MLVNDEYSTVDGNPNVKDEMITDAPADEDVIDDGQLAWALTAVLLEHGRFRRQHAITAAAVKLEVSQEEVDSRLQSMFEAMVLQRCIERCPPATLLRVPAQKHSNAMKKAKRDPSDQQMKEASLMGAATEMRDAFLRDRFSLDAPLSVFAAADDDDNRRSGGRAGNKRSAQQAGMMPSAQRAKMARLAKLPDEDLDNPFPEAGAAKADGSETDGVLWRVNQAEFSRRFRGDAIATHAAECHGDAAGAVVAAMLRRADTSSSASANSNSTGFRAVGAGGDANDRSPDQTQPQVMAACRAASGWRQWRDHLPTFGKDLTASLQLLAKDEGSAPIVQRQGAGSTSACYSVDLSATVNAMKRRELNAAIRIKFGSEAGRLFNLLAEGQQLEQKSISDRAMLPLKDTRELLYKLLRSQYLSLQDIPKTADHAPSRTFYTFRAVPTDAYNTLLQNLVQGLYNVRVRLATELAKEQEMLDLLRQGNATAALLQSHQDQIARVQEVNKGMVNTQLNLVTMLDLFLFF